MVRPLRAVAALIAAGALAAPVTAHAGTTEGRLKYLSQTDGVYIKTVATTEGRLKYLAPSDGVYIKTVSATDGVYIKTVSSTDGVYIKTV